MMPTSSKGAIRARLGRRGESFLALDGKTYEVDGDMCVIADDAKVLGLGGVIGGEETGVTDATTNVFIESAYFDPKRTARTGRRLNIQSDARYRFERGVDPEFVVPGLELATDLVRQLCGGEASKITIAGKPPKANRPFKFDLGLIERLSGLKLEPREIKQLLAALGISLDGKGKHVKAAPPSWRPDITGPADLVEEVVRLVGVDKVPTTPMPRSAGVAKPVLTESQRRQRVTRRVLGARGFVEAVTWSFIAPEHAKLFGGGAAELTLSNPISTELAVMRPSLLPGLITAAQRNRDRGFRRRRAVRAWPSLSRRAAGGSVPRGVRRSLWPLEHGRIGQTLVGRGAALLRVRSEGGRRGGTRCARRRSVESHRHPRGAVMVSSRSLRRTQAWA
jgi:phenylalanyl-tRNA synthetase beta chain